MAEDKKTAESLPPEILEAMKTLVSAIRAVKLYPPNNPIYAQSSRKSHGTLALVLEQTPEYRVGVQKTYFTYDQIPVGKEAQLNKAIAQDLFAKGLREIVFNSGVTEEELLDFYQILSMQPEELSLKGGIASILWERGSTHIKVTEAGLDDVLTVNTDGVEAAGRRSKPKAEGALKDAEAAGRSLVLGDLKTDPAGFGTGILELAKESRGADESVDDRLFALYNEAGRKIQAEHPEETEELFGGLAESALSLIEPHRENLIGGKLYTELDSELVEEQMPGLHEQVPNELHEVVTGRYSTAWTREQVMWLLKKSSAKPAPTSAPPPSPAAIETAPVPRDLADVAREMAEYTPEEMEELKAMGGIGMESDIIEAAVRTLIFLLPLVKKSDHEEPDERELKLFSGVVHQLEDLQSYLLKKKDYDLAGLIMRVFQMPVVPAFKPRMAEAARKAMSHVVLLAVINDLKNYQRGSAEYIAARGYLAALERETTEVLLELLAEESDRKVREFLMGLLKDFGKNQLVLLGEHLSDNRWYFVRNIVSVLGESKTDQALEFLHRVADHKNVRIRQEVVKGLISIGGIKAAGLLARFIHDRDEEVQVLAIHGLAGLKGIGAREVRPLLEFLEHRPVRQKGKEPTIEAIRALAKIGEQDAVLFLERYNHIRWWKSKKLQREFRDAAHWAASEITRRLGNGGRSDR